MKLSQLFSKLNIGQGKNSLNRDLILKYLIKSWQESFKLQIRSKKSFDSPMSKAEIYAQLFSYDDLSAQEIMNCANNRYSYMGDNGYYGVTYPEDLDEYQREVEGKFIPNGYVEIAYWDGDFQEIKVLEKEYLDELRVYLEQSGQFKLALKLNFSK